jgi:hypothetical protein
MLKMKITKSAFDELAEEFRKEYKLSGDDYILDLEGYEDPGELRRARDREKLEAQKEKERADKLQKERDDWNDDKSKRRGDIDALEQSWKDKNTKIKADADAEIAKARNQTKKLLVDNVAESIANKISITPKLLAPLIKQRLAVDFETDVALTRVLDSEGKPSALTLDELEKEFSTNKEFASIIRASNASGGGASGNQGGGASKAFKDMGDKERTELYKSDPARFHREAAAQKSANLSN